MHAAAKWTFIVSGVLLLVGVVGTFAGFATLGTGTPFVVEEVADFVGTEGDVDLRMGNDYTIYAKTSCESFELTLELDGSPYPWDEYCDPYFDAGSWVHVATMSGPEDQVSVTVSVASSSEVAIVNNMEYFSGEGGVLAGLGFMSCCAGILALVLGIVLMLVLDEPMPAGVVYPQVGVVGAAPVAVPVQGVTGPYGSAQAWGMPQHMMAGGAMAGMVPVVPHGTTVVNAPSSLAAAAQHVQQPAPTPDEHGLLPPAPIGGGPIQPPTVPLSDPASAPAPVPESGSRPATEALAQNDAFWAKEPEQPARPGDEFMS